MKVRTTNPTPIMAGVLLVMSVGCGAVGSPIPPERVGVNATIERQKALESLEEKRRKDAALLESTEPEPDSPLKTTPAECTFPHVMR